MGNGTVPGSGVVTGVGTGTATISLLATVTGASNATTALPQVSAIITVVAPGTRTYSLALPYPVLSMTDGQVLPVTASLIDSDGADRSTAGSGWNWSSSTAAVQVTGAVNVGMLRGVNASDTVAQSVVSVSVTAPDNSVLAGAFLVSVAKAGVASYRLVLSQNGAQINALNVLNGYPQVYASKVVRNDESDVTPDFNGLWTFTTTSPSLARAAGWRHAPDHGQHKPAEWCVAAAKRARRVRQQPDRWPPRRAPPCSSPSSRPGRWSTTVRSRWWCRRVSGPRSRCICSIAASTKASRRALAAGRGLTASSNIILNQVVIAPNSASITPLANGPFTVTARCTAGPEAMPVSITLAGVVQ